MDFNEVFYVDALMKKKREKYKCCVKTFIAKITKASLSTHAQLLTFILSMKSRSTRNRLFNEFFMTCDVQNVSENRRAVKYCVLTVSHGFCQDMWLLLMNISKETYINWRMLTLPKRDVLPFDH
eukprot:IDg1330t1